MSDSCSKTDAKTEATLETQELLMTWRRQEMSTYQISSQRLRSTGVNSAPRISYITLKRSTLGPTQQANIYPVLTGALPGMLPKSQSTPLMN